MKIVYAKFSNFKHLYSALGKYVVELDFKDMTNIINVIIGKMGSGKTTILSHLQPWASFGTLDERNSDGIIIDGKDGSKIIEITDGVDSYMIKHVWSWTKDHHSLKSYIQKNDVELNPNGNQSSFKEIIENEMGVDQNFLRLSRLGPNVSNIIDMTSTERKDFIAERLSDVDLYLTISKDMTERSRTIAAQTQLLSKKLAGVTDDKIDDMHHELKDLKKSRAKIDKKLDEDTSLYNRIIGEMNVFLEGYNLEEYSRLIDTSQHDLDKINDDIRDLEKSVKSITSEYETPADAIRRLGEIETFVKVLTSDIHLLQEKHTEYNDRLNELNSMVLSSNNDEYLQSLSELYAKQSQLAECIEDELDGFKCKYSSAEVKGIMASVQVIDSMIADILDYNRESVIECFNKSEGEARAHVNKVIDALRGKKYKLQKSLNNVDYMSRYDVSDELSEPSCGCYSTCPYYKTHPNTVAKAGINYNKEHDIIMSQIEDIDARIDKLSDYPTICLRLTKIKSQFVDVCSTLDKLGVVRVKSVKAIISSNSNRKWYDNDALVNVLEKVTKQEQLVDLQLRLPAMKAEIDKYNKLNMAELSVELNELKSKIVTIKEKILNDETEVANFKKESEYLDDLIGKFNSIESTKNLIRNLSNSRDQLIDRIDKMQINYNKGVTYSTKLKQLKTGMAEYKSYLDDTDNKISKLSSKLEDIENTRVEFGSLLRKQEIINLIKEAASSKKGIPLIYVKIFLDDCVDIINDLISMVFDDSIEIKEFNITEKEFFIPYYKNGIEVFDIKTASQGERAIISLALSFALMRKGVSKYNILLLDEIDGALYSKDREKFLMILAQQIQAINAEQVFLITHNNCFDGYPINVIMTTPEHVDNTDVPTLYV